MTVSATNTLTYDLKEDMTQTWTKEYSLTEDASNEPAGTIETNLSYFTWPGSMSSMNPLSLRTWYVLRDANGETCARAAQTWSSLLPTLPGISWIFTKVFGDLKYSADYTIWNGAGEPIGHIDGRMIALNIEFDLIDKEGNEAASVRIGSDHKYANIYRKNTSGKIGEIKIDHETLEKDDYQVSCEKGLIDSRILKLFTAITVNQALIQLE